MPTVGEITSRPDASNNCIVACVSVISLVGLPNLRQAQWDSIPTCYALVTQSLDYYDALLRSGQVGGLVVTREGADPVAIRTFRGSLDELFDLAYEYRE